MDSNPSWGVIFYNVFIYFFYSIQQIHGRIDTIEIQYKNYVQKSLTKHYKTNRPNPKIKQAATAAPKESDVRLEELHSSSEQ